MPPKKQEPLLIDIEEAARLLGLGRSTVYELIGKRELSTFKYGASRRILMSSIHRFIDKHSIQAR